MNKNIHFHVIIENELDLIIKKKRTNFSTTPMNMYNILQKAKTEWKKFYSWCNNISKDWSCAWHEIKKEIFT